MVNILILNFGNTGNKGSSALLYSKIRLLNGVFEEKPNYTVAIFPSKGPYEIKNKYGNNIKIRNAIIYDPPSIVLGKLFLIIFIYLRKFIKKFGLDLKFKISGKTIEEHEKKYDTETLFNDFSHSIKGYFLLASIYLLYLLKKIGINIEYKPKSLYEYFNADYIINTGGDLLTESYGTVLDCFSNILFAIFIKKPFFIIGESIGPFSNRSDKIIAKFIFRNTNLITTRELISTENLLNLIGKKVETTADLAFTMKPASKKRITHISNLENLQNKKHLVGINVSGIISNYISKGMSKEQKYQYYIKVMADISDYIIEKFDANVIFIPHVFAPVDNDDRKVIEDIYELIKNKDKTLSIFNEYEPEELKGIIGTLDLFLGARMHATIASTSCHVPTIGIAYSHKIKGIIGEMLDLEEYVVEIDKLSYEILSETILMAWKNREDIKKQLEQNIPKIESKAIKNEKLIKEILDSFDIY